MPIIGSFGAAGTRSFGFGRISLTLPGAVTTLEVQRYNAGISIRFVPPAGSIVSNYAIQVSTNSGSTWSSSTFKTALVSPDNATKSITFIDGLTNGTSYIVRVAANNAVGLGPWTTSSAITPNASFFYNSTNGHRYQIFTSFFNYFTHEINASGSGGYLASITSSEELSFIQSRLTADTTYWVGLKYASGVYSWASGETFSYNPVTAAGTQTGGYMTTTAVGNNIPTNSPFPAVYEFAF